MEKSRTSYAFRNVTSSLGYQLLNLCLTFINRTVFLNTLSVDYLGVAGLFGDIFTMLCMADLGFGTAMTYSMYKPLAERDYPRLAGLVALYRRIYHVIALTVTIVGLSLIPFLKYLVNLETDMPNIELYYILGLANTVSSYLVVYKTCITSADQKGYLTTKYTAIFSILKTIFTTVFLYMTHNYTVYLVLQVVFTYLINFYNSHIADKLYPFINQKAEIPAGEAKNITKNIASVFLYKVSGILINATDNMLTSVLVSTTIVGYYSNYSMIVTKLSNIVNSIFYALTSSLGNLVAKENNQRRYSVFQVMQTISQVLSTFCVVCVFVLEEDFIRIWLGSDFLLDRLVLWAMVINFYFLISLLPVWVFREAAGLYRKTKYVMLATAGVNLVVSVILGKMIGLAGIIFATSIARLTTYFWYEPILLFKNYFGVSSWSYFSGVLTSLCVTFGILMIVSWLGSMLYVTTWIGLITKGFAVAGMTLGLLFAIYWRTEGVKMITQRAKGFLMSLKNG